MSHTFRFASRAIALVAVILVATWLLATATPLANSPVPQAGTQIALESPTAAGPFLNYQGRLVDPATGSPKSGSFTMTFKLYDAVTGGNTLWTETKKVAVSSGLFNTLLGDTTALNLAVFDGRDLWLGVQVETDRETTPRTQISFTPYALYSRNAHLIDGRDISSFAHAVHQHLAEDIIGGNLSTDRFSAYADLSAEGHIGMARGRGCAGRSRARRPLRERDRRHDDRPADSAGC